MSLQEVLVSVRSSPAPTNEESAKFKIIAPILGNLGWDMFGPQVLLEHSVGDRRLGGRVDIALKGSRGVVALIEAKAPGADLAAHVSQVLGYAFHEGVDICVLTTGLEWWLYLPREKGQPEERRFAILNVIGDPLEDLADDLEAFLGNQALEAGDAVPHANRVLQAQRERALLNEKIPSIWHKMIKDADEELVEVLSKRVYNEINLRPNKEQIVAVLKGQSVSATPIAKTTLKKKSTPTVSSPPGSPTSMVLFGKHYPIKSNVDGLVTLAEVLLERDPDAFLGCWNFTAGSVCSYRAIRHRSSRRGKSGRPSSSWTSTFQGRQSGREPACSCITSVTTNLILTSHSTDGGGDSVGDGS